jgi:hypothetical protein
MGEGFFQAPGAGGLELGVNYGLQPLAGFASHLCPGLEQQPAGVLQALAPALAPEGGAFAAAHLIHRLVQQRRQVEPVQDLDRLASGPRPRRP